MTLEVFIIKVLKKIDFSEIRLKSLVGFWQIRANFWTVVQDMLKMTVLPLSQHDFRKSFETSTWFLREMVEDYTNSMSYLPLPPSLRVNLIFSNFESTFGLILMEIKR